MHSLCTCIALHLHIGFEMNIFVSSARHALPFSIKKGYAMSQQIYIPLGGKYPIPYEFEADTMPVPRGQYSVLWELRDGNITAAEAMIYLCMNHGSTWASGATWSMSVRYLSDLLGKGMSRPLCASKR